MAPLPPALRLLLPDHHRRLDVKCQALLEHTCLDDARGLAARWYDLTPELLDHMAQEDELILPDFAKIAPEAARRIYAEHTRIRSMIEILGSDIARHDVRSAGLQDLVTLLRSHARDEDAVMYPWAQQHLAGGSDRSLFIRVCGWFGVTSNAGCLFAV